ncbi:MAG TPA: hypothetical protein VE404_01980 [Verrucomicrobiae bacterium]|nr:hypothetical protein [Verrucomicrobiae bacterium]
MKKHLACVTVRGWALLLMIAGFITPPAAAADAPAPPFEKFQLAFSRWRAFPEGRRVDGTSFGAPVADLGDEIDIEGPDIARDDRFIGRGARNGILLERCSLDVTNPRDPRALGRPEQVVQSFERVQYTGAIVHRRLLDVSLLAGAVHYSVGVGGGSQGQLIPAGGLAVELRLAGDRLRIRPEAIWGSYNTPNKNLDSHFRSWSAFADYYPFRRARFLLGIRGGFLVTNVKSVQVQHRDEYDLRLRGALIGMSFSFR